MKSGEFETGPNLPEIGSHQTLAPISETEVLIVGGAKSTDYHPRTYLYNDLDQSFTRKADANYHKVGSTCAKLFISRYGKEVVLCIGNESGQTSKQAEVYDLELDQWKLASQFNFPQQMGDGFYFSTGNRYIVILAV